MNFSEIEPNRRDAFLDLLDTHLRGSSGNLKKDKCLPPMLLTTGKESNVARCLVPKSGKYDVDEAFEAALLILKSEDYDNALFSYSTKVGLSDGRPVKALKSFVIGKNGLTVVFFTPYRIKGLFKKRVLYEKSIIGEIVEDIFQNENRKF
ncbi:MAG: hypothetical protein LBP26_03050 [Clostridiales bacterium]|jgi:hypothetical protein|nr:hypothetical protein [Clostridiales bacterium]